MQISTSYKELELQPAVMASFELNHLFKDPNFEQSHSEVLGLRASTYQFTGGTIQSRAIILLYLLDFFLNFYFRL